MLREFFPSRPSSHSRTFCSCKRFSTSTIAFLEKKLQCKLNLPRRVDGVRDLARQWIRNTGTDSRKSEQTGIGQSEIGMIEDIERLHAKLSRQFLCHSSILHHGEVEIPKARTLQRVSSQVAEFSGGGRGET